METSLPLKYLNSERKNAGSSAESAKYDEKKDQQQREKRAVAYLKSVYEFLPENSPAVIKMNELAAKLSEPGRVPPKVHLISSNELNGFVTQDEVFFFTGLMNLAPNEDVVAFMEAHEIVHIEGGHAGIRLDGQNVENIHDYLSTLSRGRIHEYEADSKATVKIDQAGYAAEAAQQFNAALYQRSKKGDFDHGTHKDRQSAQILLMKAVDFKNSGQKFTPKPPELTNLPEGKHLFQKLAELAKKDSAAYNLELQRLSNEILLNYFVHATNIFNEHPTYYPEKALQPQEYREAGEMLLSGLNELLRRVEETLPNADRKRVLWCFMNLISEVADQRLSQVQSSSEALRKLGMYRLADELDVSEYLVSSFDTPQDLVEFLQYIQKQEDVEVFGFEQKVRPYPSNLLWRFSNGPMGDPDSGDAFMAKTLEKFKQEGFILQDLPGGMTDTQSFRELFSLIGKKINAEKIQQCQYWLSVQSDKVFHQVKNRLEQYIISRDPRLYDRDTAKFFEKYGEEFKEKYIQICLEEAAFEEAEFEWKGNEYGFNSMINGLTRTLYDSLPYDEREKKGRLLRQEILEKMDPNLSKVKMLWQASDLAAAVEYIEEFGVGSFVEKINKLALSRTNSPFSMQLHRYLQLELNLATEIDPKSEAAVQKLIEKSLEYILLEDDEVLSIGITGITMENYEEFFSAQQKLKLEKVQVSPQLKKYLLQLQTFIDFGISQDEEEAINNFKEALTRIDLSQLNDGEKFILQSMLHKTLSTAGCTWDYEKRIEEFNWAVLLREPIFTQLADLYLQKYIVGKDLKQQLQRLKTFNSSIAELANRYLREPQGNFLGISEFHGEYTSRMLFYVMENVQNLPLSSSSREDLLTVYELVSHFENKRETALVRSRIELQIMKLSSFDQGLEFINESFAKDETVSLAALDYFQEQLLLSPEQLALSKGVLTKALENLSQKGSEKVAMAAGVDYLFESALTDHSLEFFEAIIESGKDDTKLRELLIPIWYERYSQGSYDRPYQVVLPGKKSTEHVHLKGGAQHLFVPFEQFLNGFYEEITQTELDFLLRKLLISEEGVLMTTEGQRALHKILTTNIEAKNRPELEELLSDVSWSALRKIDPARLYQPVSSLLREKILIKPVQQGNNTSAAEFVRDKYNKRIEDHLESYYHSIQRAETSFKRQKAAESYKRESERLKDADITLATALELLSFNPYESVSASINPVIQEAITSVHAAQAHLRSIVDLTERDTSIQKISAVRAILEVAKSMGAVGVRFLQLLGQYVEIPSEIRAEFDQVYDTMRGQLKFTAYQTLEREALKSEPGSPLFTLWKNLAELSPIIGGGSLMTVYIATLKDGTQKVIKILNPNTTSFITANIQDAINILEDLTTQRKYKNESAFKIARLLIDDLQGWLTADVNAVDYEKDNQHFEDTHQGFGTGQRQISVPNMTPTGSKYVKIENYVTGQNLTEAASNLEQNEHQDVVNLVLENFLYQLSGPTDIAGQRIVHSDVHAGNVRIDDEGKVNWLDRGYFLKFSQTEVTAIMPLIEAYNSGKADVRAVQSFIDFIFSIPENKHISFLRKGAIIMGLSSFLMKQVQKGTDISELGPQFLLQLRENGVVVPIKWSLLMKNLLAINKMIQSSQS